MSAQDVYNKLRTAPLYHPASVELFDDITLQAGDVVTVKSDNTNYAVPIYAQHIHWSGTGMTTIEATGNEQREPLPALKRKQYSQGSSAYQAQQTAQNALDEVVYQTSFDKTDSSIRLLATAIGVKIDPTTNKPQIVNGKYVFDPDDATLTAQLRVEAGEIATEVQQARGNSATLSGRLSVMSNAIDARVTQTALGEALSSYLTITDHQAAIGAVANNNGAITAASIAAAIDATTGTSKVEISGDHILIKGNATFLNDVDLQAALTGVRADFDNLVSGQLTANLIYVKSLQAVLGANNAGGTVTGVTLFATGQLSIGSSGAGGATGTLYFQGEQYYKQALTLGSTPSYISEAHVLGNSSTGLSLNHYHTITASENPSTGVITLTVSDPLPLTDTTGHVTSFDIAATTTYTRGVLAARNAVAINPFTADPNQNPSLPDHRTFTYTTDAPTPASGTSRADTWYLTGGTSWDTQDHTSTVYLRYGSVNGTAYAQIQVNASDVYAQGIEDAGTPVEITAVDAATFTPTEERPFRNSVQIRAMSGSSAILSQQFTMEREYDTTNHAWHHVNMYCDSSPRVLVGRINVHDTIFKDGWQECYKTVTISPSSAQTLTPGHSVTVYAKAKIFNGTEQNVASVKVSAEKATLNDPAWNAITGNLEDHRTFKVSVVGDSTTYKEETLTLSGGTNWSGGKTTVTMKSSGGTSLANLEIDVDSTVDITTQQPPSSSDPYDGNFDCYINGTHRYYRIGFKAGGKTYYINLTNFSVPA